MSPSASQEDCTAGDPPKNIPLGGRFFEEENFKSEIGRRPLERRFRKSVVLQSSLFSPLVFLIFMNNLADDLACNHLYFADYVKRIASRRQ